MPIITCPHCGRKNLDDELRNAGFICELCGQKIPEPTVQSPSQAPETPTPRESVDVLKLQPKPGHEVEWKGANETSSGVGEAGKAIREVRNLVARVLSVVGCVLLSGMFFAAACDKYTAEVARWYFWVFSGFVALLLSVILGFVYFYRPRRKRTPSSADEKEKMPPKRGEI